ncbi:aminoglycoside phosphotransferase family protein [Streptomyces sp. SID13031]|uniref:aminoglycoside phosphotransferase family protein n=1 Tax=Streptomyces sp. SID13031 TaxID=2706046 RepID=UPI0013CC1663|nr:aminoglycoside phosphotransferase family protein [Streptomyces sp. SID13031]NEA35409.1 kinase [Streptomyces sp. SID13031]
MIELPETFLAMPRWWTEGREWLAGLPAAVDKQCEIWALTIDGPVSHGSNAIALRVTRNDEQLVLRLSPPGPDVAKHARALRWWDGRGTVRLHDVDLPHGALLLERLGDSLLDQPVGEAMAVLGRLMRRLAVPAPADALSTATIVSARAPQLQADWQRLGRPFAPALLSEALAVAKHLSKSTSEGLAANGDFHSDQVLRGAREPWIVVDPLLYRGDPEFDLTRMLLTRVHEMADDAEIRTHFATIVREAELDSERARDWVVFRTVDYWLWALGAGLTTDPERCRRMLTAFL